MDRQDQFLKVAEKKGRGTRKYLNCIACVWWLVLCLSLVTFVAGVILCKLSLKYLMSWKYDSGQCLPAFELMNWR